MHLPDQPSLSSLGIRKTVGIDLGTTNSVIALLDDTDTTILTGQDDQGRMTFPSVVGWHPEQARLLAGRAAAALGESGISVADSLRESGTPHSRSECSTGANWSVALRSVKRFMGLDRPFALGPEALSPPQVSACILGHLRDMMARTLHDPRRLLDAAVITMPAYFNHNQIEATRQAGELAGFEVVELLHEPTAAAIYYAWVGNHGDACYLVYDLGGGTFDVSLIRRRLGDYEVLSVSGDPFLGGDDFDRLLATHLLDTATWRWEGPGTRPRPVGRDELARLFDRATPAGAANFGRLLRIAEGVKCDLSSWDPVERYVPGLVGGENREGLVLEAAVDRAAFDALIKDKVDRTIDCCHEALGRARERAGLRLGDVDYVVLVGGSSRVPLVRETVRAAFCNPDLPEHVRSLEPLLHEPDLCVAYGAALRAATHGTCYRMRMADNGSVIELHMTSPVHTRDIHHVLTGRVRSPEDSDSPQWEDGSVRIRSLATGLVEEAFLDARGTFAQEVELQPETDNVLELSVCDGNGHAIARTLTGVRHQQAAATLGPAVLPTQLITKPLQIEVLTRGRQRVKQVVAPIGATLPGTFRCVCRTQDQAGRVVVPIFEENRVVKQMIVSDLDPSLPVGSPVEVELAIDVRHTIEVRVRVRPDSGGERCETAVIEPPPPPGRPTRAEMDEVQRQLDELLPRFSGSYRSRVRARAAQVHRDLLEALRYEDEPRAIQRMADLRDLVQQLEANLGQTLDPPWPRFVQLVRHCLDLAAEVADHTGREREELFEHVHAQERYAEQAYEEHNPALYRECRENLEKYAGYLGQLLRDALPRPAARPPRSPEEEAREEAERFRGFLAAVWKQARARGRPDLEARLAEIAGQARGLSLRLKTEPGGALRDTRRLGTEVEKIAALVDETRRQTPGADAGLLEGTG